MKQFELPLEQASSTEPEGVLTLETILEWPEEIQRNRYKELIGQMPRTNLSKEHIAKSILNPEAEQIRVLNENREEEREDPTFYPSGK